MIFNSGNLNGYPPLQCTYKEWTNVKKTLNSGKSTKHKITFLCRKRIKFSLLLHILCCQKCLCLKICVVINRVSIDFVLSHLLALVSFYCFIGILSKYTFIFFCTNVHCRLISCSTWTQTAFSMKEKIKCIRFRRLILFAAILPSFISLFYFVIWF